ncbi:protein of unknown function DUF1018 [Desulfatibacillum aliphaticivorans]|uniref:Regulatory protein GemA n=1 Tax=Desulfatibacillum aliphaticivorans TaxID=218208 RepID=B8FGN2_DESAL|nr:regulatory protein GemA [Desulfatibacillum aliphaticivorans]ACL05262.1 protein of unknown function DUF1018 [Desulfatibacillum aliphaticivorans]
MNKTKKKTFRSRALAVIHMAKKDLALDDAAYVEMLQNLTKKDSCAKMTDAELRKVLKHLESCGFKPKRKKQSYPGRPKNMDGKDSRSRQLRKVEAYLTIMKEPWSYADTIAKRQAGVDRVGWVPPEKLGGIITALRKRAIELGLE